VYCKILQVRPFTSLTYREISWDLARYCMGSKLVSAKFRRRRPVAVNLTCDCHLNEVSVKSSFRMKTVIYWQCPSCRSPNANLESRILSQGGYLARANHHATAEKECVPDGSGDLSRWWFVMANGPQGLRPEHIRWERPFCRSEWVGTTNINMLMVTPAEPNNPILALGGGKLALALPI
jgi:hypothetical protein